MKQLKQPLVTSVFRAPLLIFIFAFLLYSNTLFHGYVYDDLALIAENSMTRDGLSATGDIFRTGYTSTYEQKTNVNYRPITKLIFAIEWQLMPNSPPFAHFVNVLLYAFLCALVYLALNKYTNNERLALFSAFLFSAHPIHTEVVANIKSLDEILSLLFFMMASIHFHTYIKTSTNQALFKTLVFFSLALLCKESAIGFVFVFPLLLYFYGSATWRSYITLCGSLLTLAAFYLLVRNAIIGNQVFSPQFIENYLVGITSASTQKSTALYILLIYFKKLIWPYPLSYELSFPQLPILDILDWRVLLVVLSLIGIMIYTVRALGKKNSIAILPLFIFLTFIPASNLLVLIGTSYGERLLFTPSLAFCILLSILILKLVDAYSKRSNSSKPNWRMALVLILLLYGPLTWSRNRVWKDNFTLYSSDVKNAPRSARSHYFLGNYLLNDRFLATLSNADARSNFISQGIAELKKAIELYPDYSEAYLRMAQVYSGSGQQKEALVWAKQALSHNVQNPKYHIELAKIYAEMGQLDSSKVCVEKTLLLDSANVLGLVNKSIFFANDADSLRKKFLQSGLKLDSAASRDNFRKAINYLERAKTIQPTFPLPYRVLEKIYLTMGDTTTALLNGANAKKMENQVDFPFYK